MSFLFSCATVADIDSRVLIFYRCCLHHGIRPHHDDVCIEISIVSTTQFSIMPMLVTLALPPHIRNVIMMMFTSISIVNMSQRCWSPWPWPPWRPLPLPPSPSSAGRAPSRPSPGVTLTMVSDGDGDGDKDGDEF